MAAVPAPAAAAQPAAPAPPADADLADSDWGNEVPFAGGTPETPVVEDEAPPPAQAAAPEKAPEPPKPDEPPPAKLLDEKVVEALWTNEAARTELLAHPEAQKVLAQLAEQQAAQFQEIAAVQPENDPVFVTAVNAGADALAKYDAALQQFNEGKLEKPEVLAEHMRAYGQQLAVATRQATFHGMHTAFRDDMKQVTGGKPVSNEVQQRYEAALDEFDALNADPDPKKANLAISRLTRAFGAITRTLYEPQVEARVRSSMTKQVESERTLIEDNKLRELTAQGLLGQGTPLAGGIVPQATGDLTPEAIENMNDDEYERRRPEIMAAQRTALLGG